MSKLQMIKWNKHILIKEFWRVRQNWKIINGKWQS